MDTKNFPNGFKSWQETHYQIVSGITTATLDNGTPITEFVSNNGTAALHTLAEMWTDEFEEKNIGREWDGEFFDEVYTFIDNKLRLTEEG